MRRITRLFLGLALGLGAGAYAASVSPAVPATDKSASHDPIEGKWWGKAGFPQDRIEFGFEIKRNEKGEMKAYLYQPVLNFYGLELPGIVERSGDLYTNKDYAISLRLKGDTLTGTYFPLNAPAELKRTEILPAETEIPDLPAGPGPKWTAKLGGQIFAAAAVRDDIAYIGSTAGLFYALHVSDGSFLWCFVAGRAIYGEALATDDHLYFVCDNGYLFKLDRKTGKEIWRYDLGDGRVSRPLLHQVLDKIGVGEFDADTGAPKPVLVDGVLFVGSGDGSFHAVDAATGRRVWRFENPDAAKPTATSWNSLALAKNRTTAIVDGDRVFYGSFDQHMYALDRKTGSMLWDKDTRGEVTTSPLLVGGKLIFGNRAGLLAALDPASGKVLWRATFWGSAIESTPVDAGGGLFFIGASDLRRVSLIDSRDGRVVWRTDIYGAAWGRPSFNEGRVFGSAFGIRPYDMRHVGGFAAIDRKTGDLLWRWPSPEGDSAFPSGFVAGSVVADNLVLVGGVDGNLFAFPVE